jgi:hypothetical protein
VIRRFVNSTSVSFLGMLLFLAAFLCLLEFTSPLFFLRNDNATFFLPAYVHNYRVLVTSQELAQVNYHQYMGIPHLAAAQPATLYAPVYLAVAAAEHLCGDIRWTIDLLAGSHLLVAGIAMYLLGRKIGLSPMHSALLGITWATFPFTVVVARGWIFVSYLAAYLPLNLWLFLRLADTPDNPMRIVALAFLKSIFVAAGYLQYFVLSSLFEGAFLVIRWSYGPESRRQRRREIVPIVGVILLVCGLTAPLILPALEAKTLSSERSSPLPLQQVLSHSMTWSGFLRSQMLCPRPECIFDVSESIFFVGLPILATTGWVLFGSRKPSLSQAKVCAWVGVSGIVFSTVTYRLLCVSSLMATFRWPFKSFILAGFYLLLSAGMTWRQWTRRWDWGVLGLTVTIASHLFLFTLHQHRRAFSDHNIPCSVASLQDTAAYRYTSGLERVATVAPDPTDSEASEAAKKAGLWTMAFNYATLSGHYQFAGYDPIAPSRQLKAALGLRHVSQIERPLTSELVKYLGTWTVRWLVVPSDSPNARVLADLEEVTLRADDGRVAVFEILCCAPLATLRPSGSEKQLPLAVDISGNSIHVNLLGARGIVTVNCVYHPGYELITNGEMRGTVNESADHRLQFEVREQTDSVTLRFADQEFARGIRIAMATSGLILFLLVAQYRRRAPQGEESLVSSAALMPLEVPSPREGALLR